MKISKEKSRHEGVSFKDITVTNNSAVSPDLCQAVIALASVVKANAAAISGIAKYLELKPAMVGNAFQVSV